MRLVIACLALPLLSAQTEGSAEALLTGIRVKMRDTLKRLPDYTCRLNIERSNGPEKSRRLHPVDTVHLEVGYVDGKELYAWPGQKFGAAGLEEMMPAGGAVGTGDFALHVRWIFLSNAASFTYLGRSTAEGHETIQFGYRIPRAKSHYVLSSGPERRELVGYHGTFRVNARTLLLERLEIVIDEIPQQLHIRRAGSMLTYAVTRIGEADFLLPHSSELYIVNSNGRESRNITRFEQCRQYLGESVVSFADPAPTSVEAPKTITDVHLPGGIRMEITLQTALEGTRVAIGDPVKAVVSRDSVKAGKVVIPKGAKVTGRITRIGERNGGRVLYQVLGLQLSSVEFADHRAEFQGSLESLIFAAAQVTIASAPDPTRARPAAAWPSAGEGILFIKGNSLHIPAGAHMVWRTANDE